MQVLPGMLSPKAVAAAAAQSAQTRDLMQACKDGSLANAKKAIADGADVNYAEEGTCLWHAAAKGHKEVCKALMDKGAKVDEFVLQNGTPLYKACEYGFLDIVKMLVDAKANVNTDAWGSTPLHRASMNSHIEVIKYLLSKGAKVNAKNANEVTPLHWAVAEGNVDVIDTLIAAGGEVNARNANGKTPLHIAAEKGHWKVVKLLLNKGADISIKNVFGAKASETAKTYQIQDLIDAHKPGMTYKLEEDLSDSDDE